MKRCLVGQEISKKDATMYKVSISFMCSREELVYPNNMVNTCINKDFKDLNFIIQKIELPSHDHTRDAENYVGGINEEKRTA